VAIKQNFFLTGLPEVAFSAGSGVVGGDTGALSCIGVTSAIPARLSPKERASADVPLIPSEKRAGPVAGSSLPASAVPGSGDVASGAGVAEVWDWAAGLVMILR
jgi:hypothetical protein